MRKTNPQVDDYFSKAKKWQQELRKLRTIVRKNRLTEEYKWRHPCYTLDGSNIVLIHEFKDYCALLFFKGALLKDPDGILVQQTQNVQAARQIRFTNAGQIARLEPAVTAYIQEAVEVEKAGLKITLKKTLGPIPEEFQEKLDEIPALKASFAALTRGRQRGYVLHVSAAKQSKTRRLRVEKCIPRILNGKGLDDE